MTQFWTWWQGLPFRIDPVIAAIGPVELRYYGLMYLLSFLTVYALLRYRNQKEKIALTRDDLDDFLFWAVLSVVIGARIGYVVFYHLGYFLQHPLEIILPFDFSNGIHYTGISGLSYHGGVIGLALGIIMFCRKRGLRVWPFGDVLVPAVPIGYMFGRIGNFLNGELYGRVTDAAWGMVFPQDPTGQLRHPSQLYEAFGEGLLLFVILWLLRKRLSGRGLLVGLYFIGYGLVRFVIEFYRMPDSHLGTIWLGLSMGQLLCLAMMAAGMVIMILRRGQPPQPVKKE